MLPSSPSTALFPLTRAMARWLRRHLDGVVTTLGEAMITLGQAGGFLFRRRLSLGDMTRQTAFIGVDTLGMAVVMTTFFAMVIALQVAKPMVEQGSGAFVGALVSLALVRELSPIITGFSVSALAGSAFAAELATMSVTNQVDALRVLGVNPVRYLVLPRLLAGVLALPMMVVVTTVCGILGGMLISQALAGLNPDTYLQSVQSQTEWRDVGACLLKAAVFGGLVTLLSTTIGLQAKGGALQVGVATTRSLVWSFMAMAVSDYLLTLLIYGRLR